MPSGFLYSIKAIVDKTSFEDGIRELEKLEQSTKRMMKGIAGLAAGAVASATIAGQVAQQELKVAKAVGVSGEALASWKVAANIAGASASGLIGTLVSLENKMQHLKLGQVDLGLAKNLSMMKLNYGDFAKMNAEDRMRAVFNQADQMDDQKLAATLVGDILGQAGREYYDSLKLAGKSFDEQVNEARKLNFVTERNRKEASIFAMEMRGVKEAGKSITTLLGSEMGAALTPTVRKIKNYLIENRTQIQKGIQGIAQTTGAVFEAISGAIAKVEPFVKNLIDRFGGLDQIIIKVGLGFASLKFVQIAGGIRSIISGVNLLKVAIGGIGKGLIAGGLYLIFDDIITHFQGGKSVIFDKILPAIQDLKKELGFDDVDFSGFIQGLEKVIATLGKLAGEHIVNVLHLFKDLADLIKNLIGGDFDKAGENLKRFFKDYKEGLNSLFGMNKEDYIEGSEAANEQGANKVGQFAAGAGKALENSPAGKVGQFFVDNIPGYGAAINWVADKLDTATGLKEKPEKKKNEKKQKQKQPAEEKSPGFFQKTANNIAGFFTGKKEAEPAKEPAKTPAKITDQQKKEPVKVIAPRSEQPAVTKTPGAEPKVSEKIVESKEKLEKNNTTLKSISEKEKNTEKTVEKQAIEKITGSTTPEEPKTGTPVTVRSAEPKEEKKGLKDKVLSFFGFNKEKEKETGAKINDGVISPEGKVTSVSPDDWLIAVRNIEDLAGAFMPGNTYNNTTTAQDTSVTINQTFNVQSAREADMGSSLLEKAYRGTADALKQTLKASALNLQLMPGTR